MTKIPLDDLILNHSCGICFMHGRYGGGVIAMVISPYKVSEGSEILDMFTDGDPVCEMMEAWFNTEWFPYAQGNTIVDCMSLITAKIQHQLTTHKLDLKSYVDAMSWHLQEFTDHEKADTLHSVKDTIAKRTLLESLKVYRGDGNG